MNCENGTILQAVLALLGALDVKYLKVLEDGAFFCTIREYLINTMLIGKYRDNIAATMGLAIGAMSTSIVTIWVAYHGFNIIGGSNKQPIVPLMYKSARLVLILSLVALVANKSPYIADSVLDFQSLITTVVVGEDTNVYRMIDLNLGLSQVINAVIESMVGGQQAGADGNKLTTIAGLIGQSGPAMITSVLALLAEIAITFAIMLSPLFIFFLLFQQTAPLFWSWGKFLLGTFFSLAVLALVSGIVLKITASYGATVLAAIYLNSTSLPVSFDISGSAMRMATLGTLMSAILISVPPMIMQFFNAGIGFATGAMGGAAMAGMGTGRMAGGGTGVPGMAYGGGGAGQPALGSSGSTPAGGSANSNNLMMIHAINKNAKSSGPDGGSYVTNGHQPAGSAGLASQSYENPKLAQIHAKHGEGSGEFRAGGERQKAIANAADMNPDPDTGVYRSAESDAAMATNPKMGTGGTLAVAGFGTPTHMGSNRGVSQEAPLGQPSPVEVPYGKTPSPTRNP